MRRASALLVLSIVVLGGCASTHELAVDVFTDYAAGAEFDEVAVWVDDAADDPVVLAVRAHDNLADPTHVADFPHHPSGYHHVVAELRHRGAPLAQGNAWVRLDQAVLVPISISRQCTIRTCADNPVGATECVGGVCVVPMCDPTLASCMGEECRTGVCPQPEPGECVDIVCDRGVCLRLPRDARCPSADQFCNPHRDPGSATCDYLPGHEPLDAPTMVTAASTSTTTQEITVMWNSTGATAYLVELSPDGMFAAADTLTATATGVSQVFGTGLLGGHRYSARVRATTAGAAVSNVATAITFLPPPTGLTLSVTYPGGVRNASDCCWITPPSSAGNFFYEQAHASASCAFGSPQFAFRGGYTSPATVYTSGWQGPDSFIVNVNDPWGAQFWVSARCATSATTSSATGEIRDCYRHTGTC